MDLSLIGPPASSTGPEWRCLSPVCPHGWPLLHRGNCHTATWLRTNNAGQVIRCSVDFCSPDCRHAWLDRGGPAALLPVGPWPWEIVQASYWEIDPRP